MAGNFPAVAGAYKVGQVGRPQGEHGAIAVFQHVQRLHVGSGGGGITRYRRQLRAHQMLGCRKSLELAFHRCGPGIGAGNRGFAKTHNFDVIGKAGAVARHVPRIHGSGIGEHHILELPAIVGVTHILSMPYFVIYGYSLPSM